MDLKFPYSSSEELSKKFNIHSYVFLSKTLKIISVPYTLMGGLCSVYIKAHSSNCVSAFRDGRKGGFTWWTAQSYHWGVPARISSNIIFMFFLQQTAAWSLENTRKSFPKLNRLLPSTSISTLPTSTSFCTWLRTHQHGFDLLSLGFLVFPTFHVQRGCFESPTLYSITRSSKFKKFSPGA